MVSTLVVRREDAERKTPSRPSEAALAGTGMAETMGTLGIVTLAGLRDRQAQGEGVALDLLAADAFVTYAFEAAAEEGTDVTALVQRLLREVCA